MVDGAILNDFLLIESGLLTAVHSTVTLLLTETVIRSVLGSISWSFTSTAKHNAKILC